MAFENVITDVIAYLDPVDGTVPVHNDIPKPRPDEFIQVRRIGGPATPPVQETVRLDIFAWAETSPRAEELINLVRASIWALAGKATLGYMVYRVSEFMGPTQSTDVDTGIPRGWYRPEMTVRANDAIHFTP